MGGFRRIVIALANILAIIGIVLSTIGGGFSGAASSQIYGGGGATAMVVGFVLGALVGFLVAAILAAFLFLLTEIATNTRQTMLMLEGGAGLGAGLAAGAGVRGGPKEQGPPPADISQPQMRGDGPFFNVRSELSAQAQRILEVAREKGFEVDIAKDNRAILIETQQGPIRLGSNKEIEDFGRRARLG
jgi:hypothetical protein